MRNFRIYFLGGVLMLCLSMLYSCVKDIEKDQTNMEGLSLKLRSGDKLLNGCFNLDEIDFMDNCDEESFSSIPLEVYPGCTVAVS